MERNKERLIVMGGTTEPGVFHVELVPTEGGDQNKQFDGSVITCREASHTCHAFPCNLTKPQPAWAFTLESQQAFRDAGGKVFYGMFTCPCDGRRID